MQPPGLTLISHRLRPFVQRASIALAEKGVPFEHRAIDLADKPDWFLKISPLGKAPLLIIRHEDGAEDMLFESMAICEYLEETRPGPLHPADPLTRAKHRGWIEFSSTLMVSELWGFMTVNEPEAWAAKRDAVIAKLSRIKAELGDGPFFAGERFSLIDAVFAPIFRHIDTFDASAPTGFLDELPRVEAWARALAERLSVKAAAGSDYAEGLWASLEPHDGWVLLCAA